MSDTHPDPAPEPAGEPPTGGAEAGHPTAVTAADPVAAHAAEGAAGDAAGGDGAAGDVPTYAPDDDDRAPDVPALVLEVLGAGPATASDVARRIEAVHPGLIGAREGYLYALLLELRRRGDVDTEWLDRADGRRRVYGLPGTIRRDPVEAGGAIAPDRAPESRPPRRLPTPAMRRLADGATSKLAFAPRLAEDLRAEMLVHLVDLADGRERAGSPRGAAEGEAVAAFGDPWKIATDLSRAARGRRTVVFPRSTEETVLSLVLYDAGILVAILATIAFVRLMVVAAYHIPTKSMEPTLHGDREDGDRILVLRLAPPPHRFDIEVFEGWEKDRKQYVKRCVGLPGEDVRLHEGDLWIDGHLVRKEGGDLDALLFPLYDVETETAAALRKGEKVAERLKERWDWQLGGGTWQQWPTGEFEVTAGADAGVLRFRDRISDALYDVRTGETDDGTTDVGDGRVTLDLTPLDDAARVVVRWTRGPVSYDAVLRGDGPGVRLLVDGEEVARRDDAAVGVGVRSRVRFSEVDRVLRLEIDGDLVLRHDLPEPTLPRPTSPAADVSVRVAAGRVKILPVRVERDVDWTSSWESIDRAVLGPDEYFMLGDNSSNSQDSRVRGPVHASRLVGRPILVVWPPSRFHVPR